MSVMRNAQRIQSLVNNKTGELRVIVHFENQVNVMEFQLELAQAFFDSLVPHYAEGFKPN